MKLLILFAFSFCCVASTKDIESFKQIIEDVFEEALQKAYLSV